MSKKIKQELLAIQGSSKGGILHAAKVVAWAKAHRTSALHRQFEWNNSKAANEFRLWQARRLIQINIITEDGEPQLVSLSFDRPRGGGYRDVADVVSDRKLSEIMLKDALAELQRVQTRFQRVKELTRVWAEVKRVRTRHAAKQRPLAKAA